MAAGKLDKAHLHGPRHRRVYFLRAGRNAVAADFSITFDNAPLTEKAFGDVVLDDAAALAAQGIDVGS